MGIYKNECFFVSPQLPEYKQNRLTQNGISYIQMSAKEIISKLEKDIKEKLIKDCSNKLIDSSKIKKIFESEGLDFEFQIKGHETYLSTIKLLDGNTDFDMKFNITLEGDNKKSKYVEDMEKLNNILKGKSFESITIPGDYIKNVTSKINGYDIDTFSCDSAKFTSLYLCPYPLEEYDGHLYFEGVNNPEKVKFKRYVSQTSIQTEIVHNNFRIIFKFLLTNINDSSNNISDKKFLINLLKPTDIYEGSSITKLLLKWFNGDKVTFYKVNDYNVFFDLPVIRLYELDEKNFVEQLKLQDYYYSNLIMIQKYYHVNFELTDNINAQDMDTINNLISIINNGKLLISDITIPYESIKDLCVDEKYLIEAFGEDNVIVELLGSKIELGYQHLYCDDAYIENIVLIKEGCKTALIKSKNGNFFIEYTKINLIK